MPIKELIFEHIFQHLKAEYLPRGRLGKDLNAATELAMSTSA